MDNNNNNNIFMPEDKTYEYDTADIEQNKVMALLSRFLPARTHLLRNSTLTSHLY